MISDVINKTIPKRSPFVTLFVWLPSKVDSVITSENHRYKQISRQIRDICILINPASLHKCMYITALEVNANIEKDVNKGQGLGVTIWKGCCCFNICTVVLLIFIVCKRFRICRFFTDYFVFWYLFVYIFVSSCVILVASIQVRIIDIGIFLTTLLINLITFSKKVRSFRVQFSSTIWS